MADTNFEFTVPCVNSNGFTVAVPITDIEIGDPATITTTGYRGGGWVKANSAGEAMDGLIKNILKFEQYKLPAIEEVIFNEEGKTTIVRWFDGDKTVVRCGDGETFDRYTGFMAAICKKMFGGTTTAKKLMNSLDKKYQAALKAEQAAKEKAKREEEAKAAKAKADKARAKEDAMLMESMVEYFLMEAEAKKRAEEILAARDTVNLKVPFDDTQEENENEKELSDCSGHAE